MTMLQQIQSTGSVGNAYKRSSTIKFNRDYTKATVTQVFNDMLDILRKENPSIVEAMIQEGQMKAKAEDEDNKAIM